MACPALALEPKLLFETGIGDDRPEKLGKAPNENEIKDYDRYYTPSSFSVFENRDLLLVLDPIKNRVCRYSMKGEFLGEFKLLSTGLPLDFAWFPATGNAFFIFQDTSEMTMQNVGPNAGNGPGVLKRFNILDAAGKSGCKDFEARRIWPANLPDTVENGFILNINSDFGTNLAFSYRNGAISNLKEIEEIFALAASMPQKAFLFGAVSDETGARVIWKNIYTGETSSVALSPELTMQKGFGVKKIRPAGSDVNGNFYLEACFGETEDAITQNFIYKYNANGQFQGRVEIFTDPGMPSNRFLAIGFEGGVFYMKKDAVNNKIQFYKFEITGTK